MVFQSLHATHHVCTATLHCVPLPPAPRRRRRGGVDGVVAASTAPYAKYAALSSTFGGDRNDPMPEDGVANSIIRKLEVTIRVPTYSVACHCLVLNRIIGLCSLFTATNASSAAPICSPKDFAYSSPALFRFSKIA